ncbi:hypothetical protein EGI16_04710 [Chryseobacterium sp. G0240]|uniref:hypothetical protein n=1 Tax=Chryseobacterium sp. G0240 TaxID=2487066 RepID=UPI000F45C261|nr:hypothetical protein [Chryseobacterium sp. G0240]ROI05687.1 hypothetical protein EGI16_04710 [Chryseobacterium sp. G0240]
MGNARVSYAKNSAGVLEITDTNNYYPFGLNHIGQGRGLLGGYFNYKYNGKEIQETGDYGVRFYIPDIGRWGVLDNYRGIIIKGRLHIIICKNLKIAPDNL